MAALSDPAVTIASMRTIAVCTTCARRLLDKGYQRNDGSIALGEPCEAHGGKMRPQATSLITAPESEVTAPPDLGIVQLEALGDMGDDDEGPGAFEDEARAIMREAETSTPGALRDPIVVDVGPVTEIATRLLVAWSTAERVADEMMIDAAIDAARSLLKKTGGS